MPSRELPARPNLEQLKKQAKSLLHAAQAGDLAALRRFRALPAFSKKSISDLGALSLALHDAQSVIAREHVAVKKPGTGLAPDRLEEIIGRRLARSVVADQVLAVDDIEGLAHH